MATLRMQLQKTIPLRIRKEWYPKGPKIEKNQDRPPGLKFSSGAPTKHVFFVGNSEGRDRNFPNQQGELKKILGTPAGCPWDTRRDKQGSTDRCPRYLLLTIGKLPEKGILARTPAGCPWDTRLSSGFSEILDDFFLRAFP